ncbi:hypothetical protein Trydic_g13994 [Trypoxylus dichotomus]
MSAVMNRPHYMEIPFESQYTKRGHLSNNNGHSEQLLTGITAEHDAAVHNQTVAVTCSIMGLSYSTYQRNLSEELRMRRIAPMLIIRLQKQLVDVCREFKGQCQTEPDFPVSLLSVTNVGFMGMIPKPNRHNEEPLLNLMEEGSLRQQQYQVLIDLFFR